MWCDEALRRSRMGWNLLKRLFNIIENARLWKSPFMTEIAETVWLQIKYWRRHFWVMQSQKHWRTLRSMWECSAGREYNGTQCWYTNRTGARIIAHSEGLWICNYPSKDSVHRNDMYVLPWWIFELADKSLPSNLRLKREKSKRKLRDWICRSSNSIINTSFSQIWFWIGCSM